MIFNIEKIVTEIDLESPHFENDEEYNTLRKNIIELLNKYVAFIVHKNWIYILLNPKVNDSLVDVSVWKLWIPLSLRSELLRQEHNNPLSAHCGICENFRAVKTLLLLTAYG